MKNLFISLILFFSATSILSGQRTIHVFVALCDNENQGIVKVGAKIGNGQDPFNNLYWGALYGVKTHFKKTAGWSLKATIKEGLEDYILERCIFHHVENDVYLIADAYDGAFIKETTLDFIHASGGHQPKSVKVDEKYLPINGGADLLVYVGHNGLMDFYYDPTTPLLPANCEKRDAILLGCVTKSYFTDIMSYLSIEPLVWTTGLMAPEAYILSATVEGWMKGESKEAIAERAAQAYNKYQKCGIRGARNLFASGF
ncbi:MAG: hypothetical protein AAF502_22795 [Bacteroidota bacterium]